MLRTHHSGKRPPGKQIFLHARRLLRHHDRSSSIKRYRLFNPRSHCHHPQPAKAPDPTHLYPTDDTAQFSPPPTSPPSPTHAAKSPPAHTPNMWAGKYTAKPPQNAAPATITFYKLQTPDPAPRPSYASRPVQHLLNRSKDLRHLPIQRPRLHPQHCPPRMQNHIHRIRQR